jgi:hypothetical protein
MKSSINLKLDAKSPVAAKDGGTAGSDGKDIL